MEEYCYISVNSADATIFSTTALSTALHIGNNLEDTGTQSGISLSNDRIGINCSIPQVDSAYAVHICDGVRFDKSGRTTCSFSNGLISVCDENEHVAIAINGPSGIIRSPSLIVNKIDSLDPAVSSSFSISRILHVEANADGSIRMSVVNKPGLIEGAMILVMNQFGGVYLGGDMDTIVMYPLFVDVDRFYHEVSKGFNHTVMQVSSMQDKILPKKLLQYEMKSAAFSYSPDRTILIVTGVTNNFYDMCTWMDSGVSIGVSLDDSGCSFCAGSISDVTSNTMDGTVTITIGLHFIGDPHFPNTGTAYIFAINYLVSRSSDNIYQLFRVNCSYVVASDNLYTLNLQLPIEYGSNALSIISNVNRIFLNNVSLSVSVESVDYDMSMLSLSASCTDIDAMDDLNVGEVECGIYSNFLGIPVFIRKQVMYGNVVVWQVDTLPTIANTLMQLEGIHTIVFDGENTFSASVLVSSATLMVLKMGSPSPTLSVRTRIVYLYPVSLTDILTFNTPLSVTSLSVESNLSCKTLELSDLHIKSNVVLGDVYMHQPTVMVGYSNDTFKIGDGMLEFHNIRGTLDTGTCVLRTKGGLCVSACNVSISSAMAPLHILDSWGTWHNATSNLSGVSVRSEGGVLAMAGVHIPSDMRGKTNLRSVSGEDALRSVNTLRVASYDSMVGRAEIGVLAQDVKQSDLLSCAVTHVHGVRKDVKGQVYVVRRQNSPLFDIHYMTVNTPPDPGSPVGLRHPPTKR